MHSIMAIKFQSLIFTISLVALAFFSFFAVSQSKSTDSLTSHLGGQWKLLQRSIGISAMHMQVLYNNKVVIFDRTDIGASNISLPQHKCRTNDDYLKPDCTAHSVLYDIASNTFRPLMVQTDTWCSSGAVDKDGTLVQTGGFHFGDHAIRLFTPCNSESCDWVELKERLWDWRWYSSNHLLPDNRIIIVGGRRVFTYEFYPKQDSLPSSFYLSFLKETRDEPEENNLYPFLHLLPGGNLFIFANKRSISLDYVNNKVVKEFPVIPGEDKRNYPSTGSSVLLPLRLKGGNETTALPEAEVMVCGGAPPAAFIKSITQYVFVEASRTCGRLKVTDTNPVWYMEHMPMPRVLSDMLLLPTGDVILINGATHGTAGWNNAINPNLNPVMYSPDEEPTRRFTVLNPSKIPRMYHSSAVLSPDGRILVGGSNPHQKYNFTAYPYPTEISLEAFHPPYMADHNALQRPSISSADTRMSYNKDFSVTFDLPLYHPNVGISVTLIMPSFSTHSSAMSQRMIVLSVINVEKLSMTSFKVKVNGPTTATVAPPGYYMMFVVHGGIPSHGAWVKVM